MARKRNSAGNAPVEINMTDLESAAESTGDGRRAGHLPGGDIHAAGTPGGGTAAGGLAGTNVGEGSPDGVDLEDALGSGIYDNEEEEAEDRDLR